ncbi:predicted protein [Chaetoceros tenuissimus]|uniref:MYND-type domain-containing protein n=1 Tax=Chaetoceros tenuissimus TaxID=426638 RepID=A0AAD3H1Q6_9STRA|nr:predicted protein [Chaetoceros tenuissimus]
MKALEKISRDSIRNIVSKLINFQYDIEATLLLSTDIPSFPDDNVSFKSVRLVLQPIFNDAEYEILTGEKSTFRLSQQHCMSIVIDLGSFCEVKHGEVHDMECTFSGDLPLAIEQSLRKEFRFEIRARVFHMVLKYYGNELYNLFGGYKSPDECNGSVFLEAACTGLSKYWQARNTQGDHKLAKEALAIGADILFAKYENKEVPLLCPFSLLCDMGNSFEAAGDLREGADLFWESHQQFSEDLLKGWTKNNKAYVEAEEAILNNLWRAAWLYLCADDFELSELVHIHAWHYWKKFLGYAEPKILQDTLLVYYKSEVLQENENEPAVGNSTQKVNVVFRALLKRAGIVNMGKDNYQIGEMIKAAPFTILKSSFRKKNKVKKHLLNLANVPTVESFRESLLEACSTSNDQESYVENTRYDGINRYLTAADKTRQDFKKMNASNITCQNCKREEDEETGVRVPLQCECKNFHYCREICRLIHWGIHRHFCPLKINVDTEDFSFKNCRKCKQPVKKQFQCDCRSNIIYCSKECKEGDLKVHKPEHTILKKMRRGMFQEKKLELMCFRYKNDYGKVELASIWGI